jgi:hypothetical protein
VFKPRIADQHMPNSPPRRKDAPTTYKASSRTKRISKAKRSMVRPGLCGLTLRSHSSDRCVT